MKPLYSPNNNPSVQVLVAWYSLWWRVKACRGSNLGGEGRTRENDVSPRPCNKVRQLLTNLCLFASIFFLPEASFYHNLNGINSLLNVESDNLADTMAKEVQFEDKSDWINVQSAVEPSRVQTSKFSEALALEVRPGYQTLTCTLWPFPQQPIWNVSCPMSGQSKLPFHFPAGDLTDMSLGQGTGLTVPTELSSECRHLIYQTKTNVISSFTTAPSPPNVYLLWDVATSRLTILPSTSQTNLCFVPGSTRIILTGQRPIVCMVIQEAIDNLRASLLFVDAFPPASCALKFIHDALITAAESQSPAAADVLKRLQEDKEYMAAMAPLVRVTFSTWHF